MKSLKNVILFVLAIIVGFLIFILILPIMVIFYPITFYQKAQFEKKYSEFLIENNGVNFFCYNNRKNSKEHIEKTIIPKLNNQVEIVFLNGKKVESNYSQEFISQALYRLKNYNRFPHLMKIREGKLIDKTLNNPFYNFLNSTKTRSELLNQINEFFEISETKTT